MIDRCRTCQHPWRRHVQVVEWGDGTKEVVLREIEACQFTEDAVLACLGFEPTYHVEGVL